MSTEPTDDPFEARYAAIDNAAEEMALALRSLPGASPLAVKGAIGFVNVLTAVAYALTDIAQAQAAMAQIVVTQDREAREEAARANDPTARNIIGKSRKGPFTPPD